MDDNELYKPPFLELYVWVLSGSFYEKQPV